MFMLLPRAKSRHCWLLGEVARRMADVLVVGASEKAPIYRAVVDVLREETTPTTAAVADRPASEFLITM